MLPTVLGNYIVQRRGVPDRELPNDPSLLNQSAILGAMCELVNIAKKSLTIALSDKVSAIIALEFSCLTSSQG